MKKVLLLVLCLSFVIVAVNAKQMQPDQADRRFEASEQGRLVSPSRNTPVYEFTKTPTVLLESYYDYMIGSYNGIPIRNIPLAEGGYFMTFHGKRTAAGARRTFYAHLNAAGQISNINEISQVTNNEGYSTLGVDPVSGKPLYAWHANADADAENEVQFTSDAFMYDLSGLFNEIQVIVDNPLTITPGIGNPSLDNEFIWPTIQIGPSPVNGMRRVYVANRNFVSHNTDVKPSENLYLAYADFNEDMIENGVDLVWSHTSIPEMDQWNHDNVWRRPFHALTTDNLGNVYYVGYHFAATAEPGVDHIEEPNMDIFICPNYGAGTWSRVSSYANIPTWNPPGQPGGTGYFVGEGDVPYADENLRWGIVDSSHLNAVTSSTGKIIFPALFTVTVDTGGYYDGYQTVKAVIYDTATQQSVIREIYPQKDPTDTHNQAFTPWDVEAPWGVPEYAPASDGQLYLTPEKIWPFPHWDTALHDNIMTFHCNNIKVSEPNDDGLMVAVWQDSYRAQLYNKFPDSYPELVAYANTPEVYIATSNDNGYNWSEPIVLNKVEIPAFANLKPMWVYPADKVITTGTTPEGYKVGKIGFMFYNDYTWGANAVAPPAHSVNDGGAVMFMEMQIEFGPGTSNTDVTAPQINSMLSQNYPNPFNPETNISFDMPANGNAKLEIYNVKGQLVKSLFDGAAPFGRTSLVWNGTDNSGHTVTSGLYFYRLSTDHHNETRKMMLMK
ncbi:MAG: T9SS type A sorting domain-containing protein [Candidatus Cloacimonetes bacterium]|nr:T9SS type A sorting domain-containing protein [Candidatus Cloacimonadota bacterium]